MPTIIFDLDHTLCIPNLEFLEQELRYGQAKPIPKMIAKVKRLKELNHKIIIYTSRGMVSCNGNLELIHKRLLNVTENWLIKHNVPHDELIFGKPFGDFYVDDKLITSHGLSKLCKS